MIQKKNLLKNIKKLRETKNILIYQPNNLLDNNLSTNVNVNIKHKNIYDNKESYYNFEKVKKKDINKNDSGDSFDINDIPDYKKDEVDNINLDLLSNNDEDMKETDNLKKYYIDKTKTELSIYREFLKK